MSFAQIISTLESENNTGSVEYQQEEPIETTVSATDVTDGASELNASYEQIDDVDTGITSAENAVVAIGELTDAVSEKVENGGSLSEFDEAVIHTTHETIMRSLGMSNQLTTLESLTLGQKGPALVTTLENLATDIVSKVVQAFKKALEQLLIFVQDLLRNNYLLQRYWDKVNKQVQAVAGQTPSTDLMSESARALSTPIVADAPGNTTSSIDLMYATATGMMKASMVGLQEIDKLNFKFDKLESTSVNHLIELHRYGVPHTVGMVSKQGMLDLKNTYGYLANGRSMVVEADFLGMKNPVKEYVSNSLDAQKVLVGTPDVMKDVMQKASSIMKDIKAFDSKRSYIKNAISRIAQYLTQDTVGGIPALLSKKARGYEQQLGQIRGMRRFVNGIIGRFPLECFKIAKAFIDYCKNSLKYYSAEK